MPFFGHSHLEQLKIPTCSGGSREREQARPAPHGSRIRSLVVGAPDRSTGEEEGTPPRGNSGGGQRPRRHQDDAPRRETDARPPRSPLSSSSRGAPRSGVGGGEGPACLVRYCLGHRAPWAESWHVVTCRPHGTWRQHVWIECWFGVRYEPRAFSNDLAEVWLQQRLLSVSSTRNKGRAMRGSGFCNAQQTEQLDSALFKGIAGKEQSVASSPAAGNGPEFTATTLKLHKKTNKGKKRSYCLRAYI
mmetsp:Transcript_46345/g.72509  ORF Transcript_46345/g.72509 Transcript_46345/m.72509 type:complete len:246 (+) Transcript_46345:452-1189(+)